MPEPLQYDLVQQKLVTKLTSFLRYQEDDFFGWHVISTSLKYLQQRKVWSESALGTDLLLVYSTNQIFVQWIFSYSPQCLWETGLVMVNDWTLKITKIFTQEAENKKR